MSESNLLGSMTAKVVRLVFLVVHAGDTENGNMADALNRQKFTARSSTKPSIRKIIGMQADLSSFFLDAPRTFVEERAGLRGVNTSGFVERQGKRIVQGIT